MTDDEPIRPVKNTPISPLSQSAERAYRQLRTMPKINLGLIADARRMSAAAKAGALFSREAGFLAQLQRQSDALRTIASQQAEVTRLFQASGVTREIAASVRASREGWSHLIKASEAAQEAANFSGRWASSLYGFQQILVEAIRRGRRNELILAAGWLPHTTVGIPPDEIPEEAGLSGRIAEHYRSSWQSVRETLDASLSDLMIDEETKACFREALSAHELGLYRCSVRTLLPEIERVARNHFNIPLDHGLKRDERPIPMLMETLGSLPISALGGSQGEALAMLERFLRGVYRTIKTDDDLEQVRLDHVPNRHASMHGIVPYASHQHSINALVMTQFVFAMLTEHQHLLIADAAVDLAAE